MIKSDLRSFACLMFFSMFFLIGKLSASYILIPMDAEDQKDHLKAYGVTYWVIEKGVEAYWMLNYKGGSFAFPYHKNFENECKIRGVSYNVITDGKFLQLREQIADPELNEEVIKLEKAPKIAVYTPEFNAKGEKVQPWDDAVTMVLTYAEIPFDKIYDREILEGKLAEYDWLHLHHEDFTGQYGKFFASQGSTAWYQENQKKSEELAHQLGFQKVSQLKLEVAKRIKEYVEGGGFLFAMCSATDTYDIALAADGVDICAEMFDGDGMDPNAQSKLNFNNTLAFQNFELVTNPMIYEHSSIDNKDRKLTPETDYFSLFDFSAKWDPIP
ncbi:MAG TPA: asparagine synthetase B, partial [Saprospiraceae bacterium]|nr:asparagine synthetase B [Saprospiraceae bacterium]